MCEQQIIVCNSTICTNNDDLIFPANNFFFFNQNVLSIYTIKNDKKKIY